MKNFKQFFTEKALTDKDFPFYTKKEDQKTAQQKLEPQNKGDWKRFNKHIGKFNARIAHLRNKGLKKDLPLLHKLANQRDEEVRMKKSREYVHD